MIYKVLEYQSIKLCVSLCVCVYKVLRLMLLTKFYCACNSLLFTAVIIDCYCVVADHD